MSLNGMSRAEAPGGPCSEEKQELIVFYQLTGHRDTVPLHVAHISSLH